MESLWLDVRYAMRSHAASRAVAGLSILCLGLGIGVATMVFAVVNAVLLRPLPLPQPQRLVSVSEAPKTMGDVNGPVSGSSVRAWRAQGLSAELAAMRTVTVVVSGLGDPETLDGAAVSSNVFAVLGVDPVLGRAFRPEEDRTGGEGVVLLSERLWRSRFAADPRVLGTGLVVNGRSRTIAGVVPRFDHPALPASWRNAQVWLPLVWDNGVTSAEDRPLIVMARTAAGMEPAAAAARLETEAQAVNNGSNNGDLRVRVRPMDLSVSPTTRAMLLTAAVALSVVLSASASLLARSFGNLVAADRTIDLSPLLVVGLETARGTEDVIARVRSLQDVASVAVSDFTPLRGGGTRESVVLEESATQPSAAIVRRSRVTAGFFGTLGIGFDAGRPFTAMEERSRLPVVVVNRRMANQLWPHETAIGKQFRLANEVPAISYTVIGVSHDLSNWDAGMRPLPTMYTSFPDVSEDKRTLIVRATGDPRRLIQPVREIAASAGRAPRRPEPVLMEAVVRDAFSRQKTLALLFSVFSLLSLVLTAVGLYGVLSYFVSQQRRELGIRAALGAGRRDLIQLVAVRGLSMAAAGLAIGLVAAYAAMRVLRGLLYEVSTTDPLSAKVGVLVVVAVTLAASWLPAHRAASVEPARCLRDG